MSLNYWSFRYSPVSNKRVYTFILSASIFHYTRFIRDYTFIRFWQIKAWNLLWKNFFWSLAPIRFHVAICGNQKRLHLPTSTWTQYLYKSIQHGIRKLFVSDEEHSDIAYSLQMEMLYLNTSFCSSAQLVIGRKAPFATHRMVCPKSLDLADFWNDKFDFWFNFFMLDVGFGECHEGVVPD